MGRKDLRSSRGDWKIRSGEWSGLSLRVGSLECSFFVVVLLLLDFGIAATGRV